MGSSGCVLDMDWVFAFGQVATESLPRHTAQLYFPATLHLCVAM